MKLTDIIQEQVFDQEEISDQLSTITATLATYSRKLEKLSQYAEGADRQRLEMAALKLKAAIHELQYIL